jgi:uncharacterized protein
MADARARAAHHQPLSAASPPTLPLRRDRAGVVLPVRLTPKAPRDQITGVEDFDGQPLLKARVRALPEQGRANAALEKLIARWLGVPPSSVSVTQGAKSRAKQVKVAGDPDALSRTIAARIAELLA